MARPTGDETLFSQLRQILRMSGARPMPWIIGAVAASLVLALLDMLGVAAMVPLTQLISGADPTTGVLGVISDITGVDTAAELIPLVAGAIALLFIVKSIASIGFRWWLLGRTSRVEALVATELMRRYLLSPYSMHRSRKLSEVYRNINDSSNQAASVLMAALTLLTDGMLLAAIVVVLALTAPLVTLVTVALFAIFVFGLQRSLRDLQSRIGEEHAAASLEAWGFLLPGLDGFRESRLTSSARTFIAGFERAKLRTAHAGRQLALVTEAPRYALEIGFVIAIAGISLLLFATGTPGQAFTVLAVFAAASLRAIPTLNRVASNLGIVRAGSVGLRIVSTVADELDEGGQHVEEPREGARYEGEIAVRNVSYHYPDSDQLVLDQISLVIARNQTTAFVGTSGAGKSTLLDLVLGLLEPTSGYVECGGRPILNDRARWYSQLGVVPQEVFLLNDTLASNIAFGVPAEDVNVEIISEVVEMAQLAEFVQGLPDGLHTMIGERGVRLSGGQRQRIGLARALYRRPSVLVLDEATSALDNVTEREITETLGSLRGSITILVVAHRLSTVRDADLLVFLKDGRIAGQGSFEQVQETDADFARLVELGDIS